MTGKNTKQNSPLSAPSFTLAALALRARPKLATAIPAAWATLFRLAVGFTAARLALAGATADLRSIAVAIVQIWMFERDR